MRRLLLAIALLLLSGAAWAQYAGGGTVKRSGTHLVVNGQKLSEEAQAALLADINGTDYNKAWQKAKSGRGAGIGLTVGGGVALVGGGATVLLGLTTSMLGAVFGGTVGSIGGKESGQEAAQKGAEAGKPFFIGGLIAAGAGIAGLGTGIPMIVANNKRLNNIVNTCNSGKTTAQLTLGPTGNGVGLALRF